MADFILFVFLILVLGSAILYLRRARKRGIRCIGCSSGGACHGACGGCLGSCHEGTCSKDKE